MPLEELTRTDWAKVIAVVGGAGASALVASQVQKVVPQLSSEIAGAGAGVIIYLYGDRVHPLVKPLGLGILAGSLIPRISEWLGGLMPKTAAATTTGTGVGNAEAMAKAYLASQGVYS